MYLISLVLACQFKESLVERARYAALSHCWIDTDEVNVRLAWATGREKANKKCDNLLFAVRDSVRLSRYSSAQFAGAARVVRRRR